MLHRLLLNEALTIALGACIPGQSRWLPVEIELELDQNQPTL